LLLFVVEVDYVRREFVTSHDEENVLERIQVRLGPDVLFEYDLTMDVDLKLAGLSVGCLA
jgi:hypothetical protein